MRSSTRGSGVPDSSVEPAPSLTRRRQRRKWDPSVTERAEEALRSSLILAAESRVAASEMEAADASLNIAPEIAALTADAYNAPAAVSPAAGAMLERKLGIGFWMAVSWIALVVFAALFANVIGVPNPNKLWPADPNQAPSLHHLFGTDLIGHDIFNEAVYGARTSIIIGATSVAAGIGIGGLLGLIAGFYRGIVDVAVVWVVDVLLTLPGLVLVLTLVAFLGESLFNVILAIDVLSIPAYARISRATTLAVSQRDWVLAGLAIGARPRRILFRDVMPMVALPIASYAAIGASIAIIAEGALAYLGLAPASDISWGTMIANGQQQFTNAPQLAFATMIVFFLTILALNFVGQKASGALDLRSAQL
jgi:peptide/nickel transport system permease protein